MSDDDLEPLVTECPNCLTRFRVTDAQLQVATGRVRCGACLTVFQGVDRLLWEKDPEIPEGQAREVLDELLDELNEPADEQTAIDLEDDAEVVEIAREVAPAPDIDPDVGDPPMDDPGMDDSDEHGAVDELTPEEPVAVAVNPVPGEDFRQPADTLERHPDEFAPTDVLKPLQLPSEPSSEPSSEAVSEIRPIGERVSFVRKKKRRWWVPPAILMAIAALFAQVMYLQFDIWTRDLEIRPVYAWVCPFIGCELPVLRDLDQMLVTKLVVRSHPEVAGVLLVDAIIVNRAPFAQPFPVLELRFTSLAGNLVAAGRFRPNQYLAGELEGAQMIQRLTPVHIEFQFKDPGSEAVNFSLKPR